MVGSVASTPRSFRRRARNHEDSAALVQELSRKRAYGPRGDIIVADRDQSNPSSTLEVETSMRRINVASRASQRVARTLLPLRCTTLPLPPPKGVPPNIISNDEIDGEVLHKSTAPPNDQLRRWAQAHGDPFRGPSFRDLDVVRQFKRRRLKKEVEEEVLLVTGPSALNLNTQKQKETRIPITAMDRTPRDRDHTTRPPSESQRRIKRDHISLGSQEISMANLSIGFSSQPQHVTPSFPLDFSVAMEFPLDLVTSTPPKRRPSRKDAHDDLMATPPASKAQKPQNRQLQRVPTMEEILTASAKKRAQAKKDVKQKQSNFSSLASGSSQIVPPTSPPAQPQRLPSPAPRTPKQAAANSLSTPPQSRSPSQRSLRIPSSPLDRDTPTMPSRTRNVDAQGSFGALGGAQFSSQYDVELHMDDISQFLKDDVDYDMDFPLH